MIRRILLVLFLVVFCYHFVHEGAALVRHYYKARAEALARRAAAPQPAKPAQQP